MTTKVRRVPVKTTAARKKAAPAPKPVLPEHFLDHLGCKVQDGELFEYKGRQSVALGIDQSYSGFAVTAALASDGPYFTWCYKAPGTGVTRLQHVEAFLYAVLDVVTRSFEITATALEGYAFGSQMANMAGELGATVKLQLAEFFPDQDGPHYPLIVPPTNLKQYITGKGTAKKNEILLYCLKNWGVEFRDDNMADSFGLAHLAAKHSKFTYQQAVVDKLWGDPKFREYT